MPLTDRAFTAGPDQPGPTTTHPRDPYRMTNPDGTRAPCATPRCDRPTHDTYTVCGGCLADLQRDLRAIPDLLVELQTTLTRQDVHGRDPVVAPPEEARTKDGPPAAATALAFRPMAADVGRYLHATLDAWTHHLLGALGIDPADAFPDRPLDVPFGPVRPPQDGILTTGELAGHRWVARLPSARTVQLARWLDRHPHGVGSDPEGGAIVDAVRWAVEDVRRVVFPRQMIYCGPCDCSPCPTTCQDPDCEIAEHGPPVDLYVPAGAKRIRCPQCGASYETADRVEYLRTMAGEHLLSAEDMSRALPRLVSDISHRPLTASMIRGYGRRGRIREYRPDPRTWTTRTDPDTGATVPVPPTPWFKVAEVVELLRLLFVEEQEREASRTRRDSAKATTSVAAAQQRFLQALRG